jgi:hypothetical protein
MNKGISRYCPFRCPLPKVALHPRNERGVTHTTRASMVGQVARAVASFIHGIQVSSKRELDENCWDSAAHDAPEIWARICKPFKEPRNRFPAGATTLFDVPARLATKAGGISFLESIPGFLKRLQIRAPVKVFWRQPASHFIFLTLSL